MSVIRRDPRWATLLVQWARGLAGRPYVWGVTDCGSLVRGALRVLFAEDPLSPYPAWCSPREAVAAVRAWGGISQGLLRLGADHTRGVLFAGAGDIVVFPALGTPGGESACVLVDGHTALYSTHDAGVLLSRPPTAGSVYSLWEAVLNG